MYLGRALWAIVCCGAIGAWSLRRGALSPSGAAAALAVGLGIFVGGGGAWFAVLVAFFATSTLLGRVGRARKEETKREFSKGDTRDAWQVLANGGVAALAAVAFALAAAADGAGAAQPRVWAAAFLGALATANGDTWATELGILSRAEPISLTRLRRVPRGTSGAVSPLGLAATVAGAALMGLVAAVSPSSFALGGGLGAVALTAVAGTVGALGDSLLGALAQATFYCPQCQRETESPRHHCGASASHRRGLRWLGNDAVNALATALGAAAAAGLTRLW